MVAVHEDRENDGLLQWIKDFRSKIMHFMHTNHKFHLAIIILVTIDIVTVITQLILEASVGKPTCALVAGNATLSNNTLPQLTAVLTPPTNLKTIRDIEKILHYISIAILSSFMLELVVKIFAYGFQFFTHWLEVLDAIIVSVAFFLDIFLYQDVIDDTVTLLVLLRLWRVFHIMSLISEALHLKFEEAEQELKTQIEQLQRENEDLRENSS